MLDLEVRPGRSLSGAGFEFILGMPIQQAIHLIRKCDREIKGVQLWYREAVPLHMDIVICLQADGVKLSFDPFLQRLRHIEIFDLSHVKLCYCGTVFSQGGGAVPPTLSHIQMVFGATHPAEFDSKTQSYRLGFRGVQFEFAAGEAGAPNASVTQSRRARNADCPLQRVAVFSTSPAGAMSTFTNDATLPDPPAIPAECFLGLCFAEKVELLRSATMASEGLLSGPLLNGNAEYFIANTRSEGLRFMLLTDEPTPPRPASGVSSDIPASLLNENVLDGADALLNGTSNLTDTAPSFGDGVESVTNGSANGRRVVRTVRFGDSVQDVLTSCGSPTRVFYKADDKMKIHAGDGWRRVVSGRSDYFFNYLSLGVDFLFDAATHRVKKFVLHTNYPGHYDFGSYDRCQFAIPLYRYSAAQALSAVRSDDSVLASDGPVTQKQSRSATFNRSDANPDPNGDRADCMFSVHADGDNKKGSPTRENAHDIESLDLPPIHSLGGRELDSLSDLGHNQFETARSADRFDSGSSALSQSSHNRNQSDTLKQIDSATDKSNGVLPFIVTPFTKWSEIVAFLGNPDLRPVELNRSSSQGSQSPFGATFCYGVQDLIFEVMPNDHIGSVTVYQRSTNNTTS